MPKNQRGAIKILAHRQGYRRNMQVFDPSGITETLDTGQGGGRQPHVAIIDDQGRKKQLKPKDYVPTLRANTHGGDSKVVLPIIAVSYNKKQNGRLIKEDGEPMFTLTTQDKHGIMVIDGYYYYIRKLTPRECWRLQGFPDCAFDNARKVNSDSQLYKQAGNTITVPVVYDIARRL